VWKSTLEVDGEAMVDWFENNGMQANPEKFQGIKFSRNKSDSEPSLKIKDATINFTSEVKLLGVVFDKQLKFDVHISNICVRASRQINVLKRIGKHLNLQCRKMIYLSFINSLFDFCPLVWHFCSRVGVRIC